MSSSNADSVIAGHFEKAKKELKSQRDSMVQEIKEKVEASKRKTLAHAG